MISKSFLKFLFYYYEQNFDFIIMNKFFILLLWTIGLLRKKAV